MKKRLIKHKNNKGFTLVELLGVLILLIVIFLIGYPAISSLINESNESISAATKELIYQSASDYLNEKNDIYVSNIENTYCLTLEQLINNNVLTETQIENLNDKYKYVEVTYNNNGDRNYELKEENSCTEVVTNARISLIGKETVKVNVQTDGSKREYKEEGLYYYDGEHETPTKLTFDIYNPNVSGLSIISTSQKTNETVACTSSTNCISQLSIDSYTVRYSYDAPDGKTYVAERIVKVVDQEAPVITVLTPNETVALNSDSYDVKSGIKVSDNSGEKVSVIVSTDLTLSKAGTYTIKYIARDSSGNESTASRTVIVKQAKNVTIDVKNPVQTYEVFSSAYTEEDILKDVSAYDDVGYDCKNKIKYTIEKNGVSQSKVDTESLGIYTIQYSITDDDIKVTSTRTVKIVDTTSPSIVLSVDGKNMTATYKDNYGVNKIGLNTSLETEPTYEDISLTKYGMVSWEGTSAGTYYLWVKDSSGNKSVSAFTLASSAFNYAATVTTSTYAATLSCSGGRTLSGTNCTYYYASNSSQCGSTAYDCNCWDDYYDCNCTSTCVGGNESYTYTGTCYSTSKTCTSWTYENCDSACLRKVGGTEEECCPLTCANYKTVTSSYSCQKSGTRYNSCLSTTQSCSRCGAGCNTCYSANSCTKTENTYKTYTCTSGDTLSDTTCTHTEYTCPDGGTLNGTICER